MLGAAWEDTYGTAEEVGGAFASEDPPRINYCYLRGSQVCGYREMRNAGIRTYEFNNCASHICV